MRLPPVVAALLVLALVAATAAASAASVDRPAWTPGDSWTYRTNTTLTPGLNLTGVATNTFAGTQATVVGNSTVDALRIVLSGSGTASGTVATANGNVSVHGDWIVTGEERFDPTNLHPLTSVLDLSVNGTYQNLIPFAIRVQNTTTFEIVTDEWQYPLPVYGKGNLVVAYEFVQDFYGPAGTQFHANGTGEWTFTFALGAPESVATPAGTFQAYPMDEGWPDGSLERSWYAPDVGNNVRTETYDANGSLTSETTLVGYRYQALETPTFLGLTLVAWALVIPAVVATVVVLIVLRRRARKKRAQGPPPGADRPGIT